jgi:16S rRNA (uracil1498-N3)-methyltransferase
MRAIYLDSDFNQSSTTIEGVQAHHLINVLRIKLGSELLGLDGAGTVYNLKIQEILKKKLVVSIINSKETVPKLNVDFMIGKVKKEAMDLALKQCCELGVGKITIVNSEYSQRYEIKEERTNKLLISGIEQANNPYLPKFEELDFKDMNIDDDYESIVYFSSNPKFQKVSEPMERGKTLIIIGPEGGFSQNEEEYIAGLSKARIINMDTQIMRTPTAISCGLGFYLGATSQK